MRADHEMAEDGNGGLASAITRQKVAAAKSYIEQHYKMQTKSLQERRDRCTIFTTTLRFWTFVSESRETVTRLTVTFSSISTNLYQTRLRIFACLLDCFPQSIYVCAAMQSSCGKSGARPFSSAVHFCRSCRRNEMERKLEEEGLPEEQQNDIIKNLEKKETEYMRLQRHKMGADDFDLLTIIGRGAFGEVRSPRDTWHAYASISGASESMCVTLRTSCHVTSCSSTSIKETAHRSAVQMRLSQKLAIQFECFAVLSPTWYSESGYVVCRCGYVGRRRRGTSTP